MVGYIRLQSFQDRPVVRLYFSVPFWMVYDLEVVMNRHYAEYIDEQLACEANSDVCYDFCRWIIVKTQGIPELLSHLWCWYNFPRYGVCHFTEPVSNYQEVLVTSLGSDERAKYFDTH